MNDEVSHGKPSKSRSNAEQARRDVEAASLNGERIARILGLTKGRGGVHLKTLYAFQSVVAQCLENPDRSARAKLMAAYRSTPSQPQIQCSLALLELAWMIPDETPLQQDVTWAVQQWISQTTRSERARLVRAVQEQQQSPFPVARRLAQLVWEAESVTDQELAWLTELDRGYPDVRVAICRRLLLNGQLEYLRNALDYLIDVELERRARTTDPERRALGTLYAYMNRIHLEPEHLQLLFVTYVEYSQYAEVSGRLMRVLTSYSDLLAPSIPHLVRNKPETLRPAARLLRMMIEYSRPSAVQALGVLVQESTGEAFRITSHQYMEACKRLAVEPEGHTAWRQIRGYVQALRSTLSRSDHDGKRAMAARLQELRWGGDAIADLIKRILKGQATDPEIKRLKGGGPPAIEALADAAGDPRRTDEQRIIALTHLGDFRDGRFAETAFYQAWNLYQTLTTEDTRCRALETLSELGLLGSQEMRRRLWDDLEAGRERGETMLVQVMEDIWEQLFHEVPPARGVGPVVNAGVGSH